LKWRQDAKTGQQLCPVLEARPRLTSSGRAATGHQKEGVCPSHTKKTRTDLPTSAERQKLSRSVSTFRFFSRLAGNQSAGSLPLKPNTMVLGPLGVQWKRLLGGSLQFGTGANRSRHTAQSSEKRHGEQMKGHRTGNWISRQTK
jgi:hypothetical protein